MGVLRWPAEAGAGPEAVPPLAHDPQDDVPIQHLRWAVAVAHSTPSLARLFPPAELQVGKVQTHVLRSSDTTSLIRYRLFDQQQDAHHALHHALPAPAAAAFARLLGRKGG